MKAKFFFRVIFLCMTFMFVVQFMPTYALSAPDGDLVVAMQTLGYEVWINNKGDSQDHQLYSYSNETLVHVHPDGKGYIPVLAERFEITGGGKVYDFYLRKGVKFHDGWGEFTAEDAVFSFGLITKKGSSNPRAGMFGNIIEKVEAVNPYHFRITMKVPFPRLLADLSNYASPAAMACKKYVEEVGEEKAGSHPIGTGPWKFTDHKPGEYIKWEAVDNHYRKTPAFKTLTVKLVPEDQSRIAMLRTGAADVITASPAMSEMIKKAGKKVIMSRGGRSVGMILGGMVLPSREKYDPTVPWVPHQDEPEDSEWNQRALKVRKALSLAIDRDKIRKYVYKGVAQKAFIHQFPAAPSIWLKSDWKYPEYDPEKAKSLLKEAGYPNGFEINLKMFATGAPEAIDTLMAVAMDWENLGLKVNRQNEDYTSVRARWGKRNSAWEVISMGPPLSTEPWYVHGIVHGVKSRLNFGLESDKVDKIAEKFNDENIENRIAATKEWGDYQIKNFFGGPVICVAPMRMFGISEKIGSWIMPSTGTYMNFEDAVPSR